MDYFEELLGDLAAALRFICVVATASMIWTLVAHVVEWFLS